MQAELVNQIVRQVIAALPAASTSLDAVPQRVRPSVSAEGPARKVFITAQMLDQRIKADGRGGSIELGENEFLTPNATDLAEERHLTIRKASKPALQPANPQDHSATADGPRREDRAAEQVSAASVGVVIERPDEKVNSVLSVLGHDGVVLVDFSESTCWIENLRSLGAAVGSGKVAAGMVILPYAADAMVLANKMPGIRAVQGTRLESVKAALRHFDANMLIIEHAFSAFHEMRAMIRLFATQRTSQPAGSALLEAVTELERS